MGRDRWLRLECRGELSCLVVKQGQKRTLKSSSGATVRRGESDDTLPSLESQ